MNPYETAVVTVESFDGGHAQNIIPVLSELKGTCRAFRAETLELLQDRVRAVAAAAAGTESCAHTLEFDQPMCPAVANTPTERDIIRKGGRQGRTETVPGRQKSHDGRRRLGLLPEHRPGAYA